CAIVNTVLMPEPNGRTTPSAVANVVIVQNWVTPSRPPQSASLLHGWKRFASFGVPVWQSFGPGTASIWYVPGMPWPSLTSGMQVAFAAGVHVVGSVGQPEPPVGLQTSVRMSLSTRFGLVADFASATILHFPALWP